MQRLYATLTLVLALSGLAVTASAQVGNQRLAEINRSAMEAYNNLDIEVAKRSLEDAARSAERGGSKGPGLARTYSNLGVVLVGGMGDVTAGTEAFVRALREDSNVEPDPIVATPEVMAAFANAKRRAGSGRAAAEPERTPLPEVVPATGNLDHEPVPEQLAQTPVPVFVRKNDIDAANVKIFYRSLGMKKPGTASMTATEDGWAFLIPCYDVTEPTVEYFIVAEDGDGTRVGNFGDPQAPVTVNVVSTRSLPPPSLPGQAPPKTCSSVNEAECPPGLPGCHSGSKQLGDQCMSDDECSSGLVCDDDFCSLGERSGGKSSKKDTSLFFEVSGGAGLTYVSSSSSSDRIITQAVLNNASGGGNDAVATKAALRSRGYDCTITSVDGSLVATDCGLAVKSSGFVGVPILNFAAGYYFTPRFNVAVTGRVQLKSGQGTLPGIGLGLRGEYLLTKPKPKGFRAGLFAGVALGTVQAQPAGGKDGPFATSANANGVGTIVQLGVRANYRLTKNFGIILMPAVVGALPKFLFDIDLLGGLEVAF